MADVPTVVRVLVADDSAALRTVVRITIESQGWTILEATSGPEALAIARRERPDLVLLDLDFGDDGPDGLDVLAALRSDPLTSAIPVVVLTASPEPAHEARANAIGAALFLSKPFGPIDLIAALRRVLSARLADAPLGLHLVQAGAITPSQLQRALDEQEGREVPLGRLLVERLTISEPELETALAAQRERGASDRRGLADAQADPPAPLEARSAPAARIRRGWSAFPRRELAGVLLSVGLYIASYLILEPALGAAAAVFSMVTVAMAGALLGPTVGVVGAILTALVTTVLWDLTDHEPGEAILSIGGNGIGALMLLILGAGIGMLRVVATRGRRIESLLGRALIGRPDQAMVVALARDVVDAQAAALFRSSGDRSQLELVCVDAIDALPPAVTIGAIEGAARAFRELRPVVVDAPAELALFGAGAAAFVPLRVGPTGVGLLVLLHRRPGHFGTVEPRVLEALAIAAGHALERAGEGRPGLAQVARPKPPIS